MNGGPLDHCILCHGRGTLDQHTVLHPLRRDLPFPVRWARGQAFHRCRACGFIFDVLALPPLASTYEADYAGRYQRGTVAQACRLAEAAALATELKRDGLTPTSLLEIGPGPGWFLEGFRAHLPAVSYDVVELTSYHARACLDLGARTVHHGDFEQPAAVQPLLGRYDLVVSVHSIEHFFNPRACLLNLLRCARPGGLVYVHTPNGALANQRDWWHFHPEHLVFFTEAVFRFLAPRFGFEVVNCRQVYDDGDLICLLRPFPGLGWRLKRARMARWARSAVAP